jgi:hypothetical protein
LRSRIEIVAAELAALEFAANARPSTIGGKESNQGVSTILGTRRSGGGRRPGDISQEWRGILAAIYSSGTPYSYEDIRRFAATQGKDLALSSVRDRVRNLVETDLMAGSTENGFVVTEIAAKRFGFPKEIAPPEGGAKPGETATSLGDLLKIL